MGTLIAGSSIQTARIPELSPLTVDLPLDLADQLPIYIASENKTKKVPLSVLNTFFETGGGGSSHAPVSWGGSMIYKVPLSAAGGQIASIPSLAGKDFDLERGGLPLIPLLADESNIDEAEYEILDAGGFQLLKDGDTLNEDERFKLNIFSLIGTTTPGPATSAGSFVGGKKLVTTNYTLDPVLDVNKIIQVRGNATAITLTIPDVGDIPANAIIPIETSINNSKPTTITTTGGQYIYMNGGSKNSIFMHPGEVCWLYRDEDGLYVINDFYKNYRNLCKPDASYKVGDDEVLCNGQEVNRSDLPRIWEEAQTLGFSLVSEATWQTAEVYHKDGVFYTSPPAAPYRTILKPYRGCFSTGNGTTTMRLPDLNNVALRGLKTGSDSQRYLNNGGIFQRNEYESHNHSLPPDTTYFGSDGGGQDGGNHYDENHPPQTTGNSGGTETRMDNVGVLWVLKK